MDTHENARTVSTMPGFKPLQIVPWNAGYGCDVKCGELIVGGINEGFRGQYRAEFEPKYCRHTGWRNTHDYFNNEESAIQWIRGQWCAFLNEIGEPIDVSLPSPENIIKQQAVAMGVPPEIIKNDLEIPANSINEIGKQSHKKENTNEEKH